MTSLLEQAIEQLRDLPEEEQDAAADVLFAYVSSEERQYRLRPHQITQVRRIKRLARWQNASRDRRRSVSAQEKAWCMKVRFTLEALNHIAGIHFYIESRSPEAAVRITTRIFAEADRIGEFPQIGHVGAVAGTYEWTVAGLPYVIVHEIDFDNNPVVIIGVFHGAQNRRG